MSLFAPGLNLFTSALMLFAPALNLFASTLNLFASALVLFTPGLNLFAASLNLFGPKQRVEWEKLFEKRSKNKLCGKTELINAFLSAFFGAPAGKTCF